MVLIAVCYRKQLTEQIELSEQVKTVQSNSHIQVTEQARLSEWFSPDAFQSRDLSTRDLWLQYTDYMYIINQGGNNKQNNWYIYMCDEL